MIVSEKIAEYFEDKYLYAGLTYNGHALACATALATIEVYEEDSIENSAMLGIFWVRHWKILKSDIPQWVMYGTSAYFPPSNWWKIGRQKYLSLHRLWRMLKKLVG